VKNVAIKLKSDNFKMTPARFKESGKRQGFVVPRKFRKLMRFGVVVTTSKGFVSPSDIDIALLKGNWRVGIDHAPFQEEFRYLAKGQRCFGFIHFRCPEPECIVTAPSSLAS
jgi:hypothetical protein